MVVFPARWQAAGSLVLLAPGAAAAGDPAFVERAAAAGLTAVTYAGGSAKNHILESTGNGVLVVDYDGDGWPDVYLVSAYRLPPGEPSPSRLYRNRGDGTFADVSEAAGVAARVYGHGGAVGDADGDGLADLYVTAFGPNLLYRNRGDGTFAEVGEAAGVADPGWSIGATFFDADADGDLDLYVANYIDATWEEVLAARRTRRWRGRVDVMDGPRGLPPSANRFFRNDGGGSFRDATAAAGLAAGAAGYSMGVVSLDYDADGDVDLYVANDSTSNCLYRNRGDGTFDEVGLETGSALSADGTSQGSMGVHAGDYDGDGWLDLAVTNFAHDAYNLYRNLGGQMFADQALGAGLAVPTFAPLGWGALFFDADADGDLDLFFANGHIYPQVDAEPRLGESFRQANQLFLNAAGRYREAGDPAGPDPAGWRSSRGAVYLDADGDGDLDLLVSNQDAPPTYLENRGAGGRRWIAFALGSGVPGARLELRAGGRRQLREATSGGSYASHNDDRLHFGLGAAAHAEGVAVRWPRGGRRVFAGLSADRYYVLAERPRSARR